MMRHTHRTSLLAALLLLAGVLTGCDFAPGTEAETPPAVESPTQAPGASDHIECSGLVRGGRAWSLTLGPGERVQSVSVRKGQTISEGAELLLLDKPELDKMLHDASERLSKLAGGADRRDLLELRIRQQRSVIDDWSKRIEEERALGKQVPEYPIGPRLAPLTREREKADAALKVLELERTILEKEMKRSETLANDWRRTIEFVKTEKASLRVLAPRRVQVVAVHPLPRRAVSGESILGLVDDEPVHVVAEVPQHQIPRIRAGQKVEILTDFSTRSPVKGEVEAILPLRDTAESRYPRFPVRVRVTNADGRLVPGMRVTVLIEAPPKETRAE
jgi:multidrug resistance efflux pump